MTATEGMDQFPEPTPLPRMYQNEHPVPRETDSEAWRDEALCAQVGGDGWFPERGVPEIITVREARNICAACPVAAQCLQYALDTDQRFGIWGGKSPKQRDNLRNPQRHVAKHGTDAMYRKGCHTDADCPDRYTCAQAHRDYQRAWDQKQRANGRLRGRAAQNARNAGAA